METEKPVDRAQRRAASPPAKGEPNYALPSSDCVLSRQSPSLGR